jgi:hypothetical protein
VTPKLYSSNQICAAIAQRYEPPAWAVYYEVGDTTGGRSRSADAIAVSLWPSRGLEMHGFEIKVSRGDWLRELQAPAKSAPIQRFMDRWYIAVGDSAIVRPGELPPTWGLLAMRGSSLAILVEAPKLEAEPIGRPFLCAMLRAGSESFVPKRAVAELVEAKLKDAVERNWSQATADNERLLRRIAELEEERARLGEIVGPHAVASLATRYVSEEQKDRLRRAIAFMAEGGFSERTARAIEGASENLRRIAEELDAVARGAKETS